MGKWGIVLLIISSTLSSLYDFFLIELLQKIIGVSGIFYSDEENLIVENCICWKSSFAEWSRDNDMWLRGNNLERDSFDIRFSSIACEVKTFVILVTLM